MKTKDTIAAWLLALFVLVPFGKALYGLVDALRLHGTANTILWGLGETSILAVSGLFVIARFLIMTQDLQHYEAHEKQREKGGRST